MKRVWTINDLILKKHDLLSWDGSWRDAFGEVERCGSWFVWGNSGNGKSVFALQLGAELSKFGRVLYNSLEEETDHNFCRRLGLIRGLAKERNFHVVSDSLEELNSRLLRQRSADFVIIDSVQDFNLRYDDYLDLRERYRDKLFIYISKAQGTNPMDLRASKIMYRSELKIWVEGFVAFSHGRSRGSAGCYVIWAERAKLVHGETMING